MTKIWNYLVNWSNLILILINHHHFWFWSIITSLVCNIIMLDFNIIFRFLILILILILMSSLCDIYVASCSFILVWFVFLFSFCLVHSLVKSKHFIFYFIYLFGLLFHFVFGIISDKRWEILRQRKYPLHLRVPVSQAS